MKLCRLCKYKYAGIVNINIKSKVLIVISRINTVRNIEYLLTPPIYAA